MEFKLVKEEDGLKKVERQQQSFNTGTILDASVGVDWDGNSSYAHIAFESNSDQESRVRVQQSSASQGSKLEIFIDGEWEAKAMAQAMEWAAQRILRRKQAQLTHEQARAFLDALCGTEALDGGGGRPTSRAVHTHLAAVLGLNRVPTDAKLSAGGHVDPDGRIRGVANYLIAAGLALTDALEHERDRLSNQRL